MPLRFEQSGLDSTMLKLLGLKGKPTNLDLWKKAVGRILKPKGEVKIALVGKYFKTGDFVLSDVYISVIEAIKHAGYSLGYKPTLEWIDSEIFEKDAKKLSQLSGYDAVVVPGGFGSRGIEGILFAIEYARTKKIPYLGLCYGMQLAVIEYARNKAGLVGAHTTEVNPKTPFPVVDIMEGQVELVKARKLGGTMRLGSYPAVITKSSRAHEVYGALQINERHRHRYEVNPKFVASIQDAGLIFSGKSPDGNLMEILELPKSVHPFFMASQFHPEFTSRFLAPNALFVAALKAAIERKQKRS